MRFTTKVKFYDHKNWGIQGNSAKSTNIPMSSFGLCAENTELSPIYQAVTKIRLKYIFYMFIGKMKYICNFVS